MMHNIQRILSQILDFSVASAGLLGYCCRLYSAIKNHIP